MARLISPAVAARKAAKQHRETRRSRLLLVGIILLMAASTLGYLLYLLPRLRASREHSHKPRP
jgi:hypothetical protein